MRTREEVCQGLETMRPPDASDRLCRPCGMSEQQRQRDLGRLVRALVISAGTPGGAYQANFWRSYLAGAVPRVARSAVSRGCDAPLERCMAALAERARASARAQPVERSGLLCAVTDGSRVDATTVKGRNAWREDVPATGAAAAMQVHTVRSVGWGAPVPEHVRPAREPESRPLELHASWRGDGLLADRASARLARRRAGDAPAVPWVSRRTDQWKPTVEDRARGQVPQECLPGAALEGLRAAETLRLEGRVMEADGPVGQRTPAPALRLVGVHTPKGDGGFLTHLPPRLGPRDVAELDRGRGEVALRLQVDPSVPRSDALDAARPCALKARLPAARRAQTHHLPTRPQRAGAPRPEAPLHPRRVAWPRAVSCPSSAHAFDLQGGEAQRRWDKRAALLTHAGTAPQGCCRPSL